MSRQDYYQDQWQSWEEEPGGSGNRWLLGVVIGLVAVCLLAACAAGLYWVALPLVAEPAAATVPLIPTLPGTEVGEEPADGTVNTPTPVGGETDPAATATESDLGATPTLAAATTPATTPAPTPQPISDIVVSRMPAPPAIDGNLSEWAGFPGVPSAYRVYQANSWDGSVDLEATWRLAWDADNLYIGVEVVDDTHVQTQTGNQIFRGDSLDMQFDTNPDANARRLSPATYQIIFSPGNFGGLPASAFRFRGTDEGRILDFTGHNVQVAAQPTSGGYTLEAAIPWRDLNVTPQEGLVLGVALNANDNDRPGQAVQEVMMSHVPTRTLTDPAGWGTLVLQ